MIAVPFRIAKIRQDKCLEALSDYCFPTNETKVLCDIFPRKDKNSEVYYVYFTAESKHISLSCDANKGLEEKENIAKISRKYRENIA